MAENFPKSHNREAQKSMSLWEVGGDTYACYIQIAKTKNKEESLQLGKEFLC